MIAIVLNMPAKEASIFAARVFVGILEIMVTHRDIASKLFPANLGPLRLDEGEFPFFLIFPSLPGGCVTM